MRTRLSRLSKPASTRPCFGPCVMAFTASFLVTRRLICWTSWRGFFKAASNFRREKSNQPSRASSTSPAPATMPHCNRCAALALAALRLSALAWACTSAALRLSALAWAASRLSALALAALRLSATALLAASARAFSVSRRLALAWVALRLSATALLAASSRAFTRSAACRAASSLARAFFAAALAESACALATWRLSAAAFLARSARSTALRHFDLTTVWAISRPWSAAIMSPLRKAKIAPLGCAFRNGHELLPGPGRLMATTSPHSLNKGMPKDWAVIKALCCSRCATGRLDFLPKMSWYAPIVP